MYIYDEDIAEFLEKNHSPLSSTPSFVRTGVLSEKGSGNMKPKVSAVVRKSLNLPLPLAQRLAQRAAEEGRSEHSIVIEAIERYLTKKKPSG